MTKSFELILFDLDDTLLYFEDYWEQGTKEAFRQFPITESLNADRLFETYQEYSAYYVEKYHQQEISIQQFRNNRFIRTLNDWGVNVDEAAAHRFNELYHEVSTRFMIAAPELSPLLDMLQRSYKLGIVTNGTREVQFDKLKALGIESYFPQGGVIISDDIGWEKPDPRIYEAALSFFAAQPETTLFVGDSWKNDVVGPGSLGIASIWLNKKGEPAKQHPTLFATIERLDELGEKLTS
ncbi:HAD family hydrolase [Paenibacillus senegalensis]|uniref:HAD family hydrolase n=1 Tax=Paenibacillus senegalensis TaxID=1465766 RepID=UPI000288B658|nr:HAD family hydrolase [Paenibacillus senegalensis]